MLPHLALVILIFLPLLWFVFHGRSHGKLPPGPRPLPIIGSLHMLGHLPHRSLAKLSQRYGPIMSLRLGQVPTIIVSSPQAAELFLKKHDNIFASRPLVQATVYLAYGAKDLAFAPYGDYWRRMRKMCTLQLLSAAKVESFAGLRKREVEAAVRQLKKVADAGEVVNVDKSVGELIEEIIFKMVVGESMMEKEKRRGLKDIMEEIFALTGAFNISDFVPFLAPFDLQGLARRMKATSQEVDKILENIIDEHLNDKDLGSNKDTLSTMLMLMNNPNDEFLSSFNRENVKAIILDLFAGGIDTSAVSVVWAISALLKQPRVMKILKEELDANVGRDRMVTESDLPQLSYLDMVVKETLRLYPVAPLLVPHESMEDIVINGYMIPSKSRIFINYWAIARDHTVWKENAEEFYPERFANGDIDFHGRNFEFIPFGAGRRGCPGLNLGLVTVKIVLAQLIHCFNWEIPGGMHPQDLDMTEKFGLSMPRATKLLATPSYRLTVNS